MEGSDITVTVEVPGSPPGPTTPTTPVQPRPAAPPLADTGIAVGALLILAVLLIVIGARLARRRPPAFLTAQE